MLDHLEIRTRKLNETVAFYRTVLAPLGYVLKVDGAAKGFGDATRLDMFVAEGDPSGNVHFAFEAKDRDAVDRIYSIAGREGLTLDRAPAAMPHIHPNYYAGFLRDPDGRLIEFVCHTAGQIIPERAIAPR